MEDAICSRDSIDLLDPSKQFGNTQNKNEDVRMEKNINILALKSADKNKEKLLALKSAD